MLRGSSRLSLTALRPASITIVQALSASESPSSSSLYRLPLLSASGTFYLCSSVSLLVAFPPTPYFLFHWFGTPYVRYPAILYLSVCF